MVFIEKVLYWTLGLVGFAVMGLLSEARAQSSPIPFFPSETTAGMLPVSNLHGAWTDEENRQVQVPFIDEQRNSILLHRTFDLPTYASLPDTLYLYFEGLAWTAEVYVNKRLIAVTEDPFAEHLFILEKGLLQGLGNSIELRLSKQGADFAMYPTHFVGVHRQALLLVADPMGKFPRQVRWAEKAKKALVVAPWCKEEGFLNDTVAILGMLDGLFSIPPNTAVSFPFRPSSHAWDIVARMNVLVVPPTDSPDSLGFYNSFPISLAPQPLITPFWRDIEQRPGSGYGRYLSHKQIEAPQVLPLDKFALSVFLLLPVLIMLLLKLLAPRIFDSIPEYLTRNKIYLELIAGNKFLKDEQRLVMNLIRITFLALTVSYYLYYLSVTGAWERLNLLSADSLLYQLFSGTDYSLYTLFLQTWAVIGAITVVKYFALNFISTVYRVHNFSSAAQSLDIYASFPMNLLPMIPGAVIFFLSAEQGQFVLVLWYALMLLQWLRRIYLIYAGLSRLFPLSVSLKILYICTLEISPWIFLL